MNVPLTILVLLVCCVANALGQTSKRELTPEWVFGPEGRTVASVPTTAWLDDGSLVILDNRRPASEQTFEKLNPATGQKQSIVDSALRLHASDGSLAQTLAGPRPQLLEPFDVQPPELFTIPADDGFPMPAEVLKPKNFRADRKFPVVMFIYGGASAPQVINGWQGDTLWNQLLLNAGYVVVKVDNRSATGISKELENTILKRLGEAETPDLVAAARWLKKQSWVDPARVGVWSWSYGGLMTVNLMTRSQEFKAGIAVAFGSDWRYYDTKWTEGAMRTPQENPKGYENASLLPLAKQLHGRLLIVFGTYDDNVHPYNDMAFIDALITAGKKFDMMAYPMRKHGISDEAAQLHLYRLMLDFWKENL